MHQDVLGSQARQEMHWWSLFVQVICKIFSLHKYSILLFNQGVASCFYKDTIKTVLSHWADTNVPGDTAPECENAPLHTIEVMSNFF